MRLQPSSRRCYYHAGGSLSLKSHATSDKIDFLLMGPRRNTWAWSKNEGIDHEKTLACFDIDGAVRVICGRAVRGWSRRDNYSKWSTPLCCPPTVRLYGCYAVRRVSVPYAAVPVVVSDGSSAGCTYVRDARRPSAIQCSLAVSCESATPRGRLGSAILSL